MPKDRLQSAAQGMSARPASKLARWVGWQWTRWLSASVASCGRCTGYSTSPASNPSNRWLAALGLGQRRVRQAAAPVATTARRVPDVATLPGAATTPPADLRRGWQANGAARRPLRVLAVSPTQKAPQVWRTLPGRQPAAPLLHRRTGLARREGGRAQPDGHSLAAPADRRAARRADGRTARRSGWRSTASCAKAS